jgi:hypothetical protein
MLKIKNEINPYVAKYRHAYEVTTGVEPISSVSLDTYVNKSSLLVGSIF